ncbi:unnamed protein product [Amoebophrya sp. A120]|nr:unnamed protein product [Amoebophrya sp. A120]|eukprot:GSA120T00009167001.1
MAEKQVKPGAGADSTKKNAGAPKPSPRATPATVVDPAKVRIVAAGAATAPPAAAGGPTGSKNSSAGATATATAAAPAVASAGGSTTTAGGTRTAAVAAAAGSTTAQGNKNTTNSKPTGTPKASPKASPKAGAAAGAGPGPLSQAGSGSVVVIKAVDAAADSNKGMSTSKPSPKVVDSSSTTIVAGGAAAKSSGDITAAKVPIKTGNNNAGASKPTPRGGAAGASAVAEQTGSTKPPTTAGGSAAQPTTSSTTAGSSSTTLPPKAKQSAPKPKQEKKLQPLKYTEERIQLNDAEISKFVGLNMVRQPEPVVKIQTMFTNLFRTTVRIFGAEDQGEQGMLNNEDERASRIKQLRPEHELKQQTAKQQVLQALEAYEQVLDGLQLEQRSYIHQLKALREEEKKVKVVLGQRSVDTGELLLVDDTGSKNAVGGEKKDTTKATLSTAGGTTTKVLSNNKSGVKKMNIDGTSSTTSEDEDDHSSRTTSAAKTATTKKLFGKTLNDVVDSKQFDLEGLLGHEQAIEELKEVAGSLEFIAEEAVGEDLVSDKKKNALEQAGGEVDAGAAGEEVSSDDEDENTDEPIGETTSLLELAHKTKINMLQEEVQTMFEQKREREEEETYRRQLLTTKMPRHEAKEQIQQVESEIENTKKLREKHALEEEMTYKKLEQISSELSTVYTEIRNFECKKETSKERRERKSKELAGGAAGATNDLHSLKPTSSFDLKNSGGAAGGSNNNSGSTASTGAGGTTMEHFQHGGKSRKMVSFEDAAGAQMLNYNQHGTTTAGGKIGSRGGGPHRGPQNMMNQPLSKAYPPTGGPNTTLAQHGLVQQTFRAGGPAQQQPFQAVARGPGGGPGQPPIVPPQQQTSKGGTQRWISPNKLAAQQHNYQHVPPPPGPPGMNPYHYAQAGANPYNAPPGGGGGYNNPYQRLNQGGGPPPPGAGPPSTQTFRAPNVGGGGGPIIGKSAFQPFQRPVGGPYGKGGPPQGGPQQGGGKF